ncbi:MAG TPA: hypothetical protein VKM93_18915 [Terriglobia bacterium]|nr:hypothetical protein [Terriglobia bacterium]
MKNEATELIDNKGSGLTKTRNEATVWGRKTVVRRQRSGQEAVSSRQSAKGRCWHGKLVAEG